MTEARKKESEKKTDTPVTTRPIGCGVARRLVPSSEEVVTPSQPSPERNTEESVVWQDIPSMKGQYEKFPESTRTVNSKVDVFDLSKPEDKDSLNKIMTKRVGAAVTDPLVVIHEMDKQFYQGVFYVYILHSQVQYKKLIPSKKDVGGPK